MQNLSLFKQSHWRWASVVALLAVIGVVVFTLAGAGIDTFAKSHSGSKSSGGSSSSKTVTVYIQATDSCMQALPGGSFVVNGPGVSNKVISPASGSGPVGLPGYVHGHCPIDRGNCVQTKTGCASVTLNVPSSGTATYTITPQAIAGKHYLDGIVILPSHPYGANYSYVWCEGGSDCKPGPEVATVHVTSSGSVSATTQNINPDGFKDKPWPSSGSFAGTMKDPVMFHLFGASGPTDFTMVCNQAIKAGDTVKKDPLEMHMTGNPNWSHCRSGR